MAPLTSPQTHLFLCFGLLFVMNMVFSSPSSDPILVDPLEEEFDDHGWDAPSLLNLTDVVVPVISTPPPARFIPVISTPPLTPPVATRPTTVSTATPEPADLAIPRLDKVILKIASKRPPHVMMPMGDVRVPSADAVAGRIFVTPA